MMNNRLIASLSSMALVAIVAGTASATVLNFAKKADGTVPGNNQDINVTYGSNVANAANVYGATDGGEGFTPNIAVAFGPTGGPENVAGGSGPNADVLEFHSAATFSNPLGPAFTVPVLQLDVDLSNHLALPGHPTIDFVPDAGYRVRIHELKIGNASDQLPGETPHPWVISVLELPSLTPTGTSYTTAALGAGNNEIATFNFTGLPGVSYRLLFDDGDLGCTTSACHNPRTGIDDIRFSQIAVPEPTSLALLVSMCGLGALVGRRRHI